MLETYAGKYKLGNDTLPVMLKNDVLYIIVQDKSEWKIHFTDDTHWFVAESRADLNFERDANRKVTGFAINKDKATKIE